MTDETPLRWRKSSRSSDQGECVEVAVLPSGAIAVRDSKHPDGPRLTLTPHAFRHLLDEHAKPADLPARTQELIRAKRPRPIQ